MFEDRMESSPKSNTRYSWSQLQAIKKAEVPHTETDTFQHSFPSTICIWNATPSSAFSDSRLSPGWGILKFFRVNICADLSVPALLSCAQHTLRLLHTLKVPCPPFSERQPEAHHTLMAIQDTATSVGIKRQRRQSDRYMLPMSALAH